MKKFFRGFIDFVMSFKEDWKIIISFFGSFGIGRKINIIVM